MDKISSERRSANMRRIRGKNTGPELRVRRTLRELGVGYRLHAPDLPGKPDIVMRTRRVAIFVHGCFWHRHPGCRRAFTPASRPEWWLAKLTRNVERDAQSLACLKSLGWRALVIWECETGDQAYLTHTLARLIDTTDETKIGGKGVDGIEG